MGEGSSDWEGVRWYNDGAGTDGSGGYSGSYYWLLPSSLANDKINDATDNERDNSDFMGIYDTVDGIITIIRETTRDEQTLADGSVTRIEKGRTLSGWYWNASGGTDSFEFTLEGAHQVLLALTAGAIGAMGLLAF